MLENTSLDKVKQEFLGIWPGTVINNKDPMRRGRLQIRVPQIFGAIDTESKIPDTDLPWSWPCLPYVGGSSGLVMIPEIGSGVWVSFFMGDTRSPIWLGGWLSANDDVDDHSGGYAPDPKLYIIKSPSGHKIIISEKPGDSGIFIIDKLGQYYKINSDRLLVEMNCLGEHRETVALSRTEMVGLNHTKTIGGAMTYNVTQGITISAAGLLTLTSILPMLLTSIALLTLTAVAGITITSIGIITILSSVVTLGIVASAQKLCNKTFMDLFNAHTHTYSPGPGGATQTGAPIVPAVENTHTTAQVKAS